MPGAIGTDLLPAVVACTDCHVAQEACMGGEQEHLRLHALQWNVHRAGGSAAQCFRRQHRHPPAAGACSCPPLGPHQPGSWRLARPLPRGHETAPRPLDPPAAGATGCHIPGHQLLSGVEALQQPAGVISQSPVRNRELQQSAGSLSQSSVRRRTMQQPAHCSTWSSVWRPP